MVREDFIGQLESGHLVSKHYPNPFISTGIRLAEKRSLPCPRRTAWYEARDRLYEDIMEKGYNKEKQFFAQSYEDLDILDSSLLIMPLVFFSTSVSHRHLLVGMDNAENPGCRPTPAS